MTQILQGAGGGIAAVASQTAAQGSVPHQGLHRASHCLLPLCSLSDMFNRCRPHNGSRFVGCRAR